MIYKINQVIIFIKDDIAPDEYRCELFFSCLKDPVKLPSSGKIVER